MSKRGLDATTDRTTHGASVQKVVCAGGHDAGRVLRLFAL